MGDNDRLTWRNKFEFAFNVIGYNVGIGNIWRFSYLCYKNGGGAFLIPYFISALVLGVPLMFFELATGQYTRHGCIAAWDILPIMRGLGFAQIVIVFLCNIFFVFVMSWCVLYFFKSFTLYELDWGTCDNWWNTERCVPLEWKNFSRVKVGRNSSAALDGEISAPEEFFNNYVLQRSTGLEDIGGFTNWKLLGCFVLCWAVCYLCVYKGIRTSGKAAYFTVISPYVLLLALFIRGVTLEGAGNGIRYYISPNATRLLDPEVWLEAGSQIVFSLGVCFGCFYSMGSYNKKNFDCYKSAYYFVLVCCGSSVFFGLVVFCYIGNMAHTRGQQISEISEGGPGLVFIVFPKAFATLPAPQIWAAMFFLALIFLAMDGVYCLIEGFLTALADYWPQYFDQRSSQKWRIGICVLSVVVSLPQFCDNGIYIFEILNRYAANGMTLLWLAFFESVAVGWIYGIDRFWEIPRYLIGYYPSNLIKYCLKYVTPTYCLIIFVACCFQYKPLKIGNYVYPSYANAIGWMLTLSSILCIPFTAIYTVYSSTGSIYERLQKTMTSKLETLPSASEKNGDDVVVSLTSKM